MEKARNGGILSIDIVYIIQIYHKITEFTYKFLNIKAYIAHIFMSQNIETYYKAEKARFIN